MTHGLLIIDRTQYGRLTDSYKWSQNLAERMPVHYVCFDYGRERYHAGKVNVNYVSRKGLKQLRAVKLLAQGFWRVLNHRGPVVVEYFPKCHLFKKLFPKRKLHIDIRTMSVFTDPAARQAMDADIRRCCRLFDSVSAISQGVANQIGLPDIKILPLGADAISNAPKRYDDAIRAVYVGTFFGRRIDETVRGVKQFALQHPEISVRYDLYGSGDEADNRAVEQAIEQARQAGVTTIEWHGRKPHSELKEAFDKANVGMCYVPITDYYQDQPPTKTYEYAMSGIYTIGTSTRANAEIITDDNGVLIGDTPAEVARGLEHYWNRRNGIDEGKVRESLSKYSWANICANIAPDALHLQ